ncbi:glycosyltransferase family 22 protein [Lepidopterella palustris CBS 459.81]|uniref:Mannosyltransferase n=1 Tax=Lepidopterella palustris CBS 459.81 TaxID=1314670 RepID=A0A8E2EK94_9PEZI|nr:glycosyltransferase family 22 protein [Lepidopterella palustris CBS 459.81]
MPFLSASATGGAHQTTATITSPTGETNHVPLPDSSSYRVPTHTVLALLLALRIVNALTLRTFFQPDEFFQSLEPAWQIAFGRDSGAWITWEWRTQLRSSLHPALFAGVYQLAANLASALNLNPISRAELFIAAPKVTQAIFAALLDCYTWRLAESIYGRGTRTAWATLALSVCSPWQWFCSTRTLSNCVETTLTSIAVYHWPWQWPDSVSSKTRSKDKDDQIHGHQIASQDFLLVSLLLAAFACILRPTNLLVWLCLSFPTLRRATTHGRCALIRQILLCGSAVLALSVLSDRLYYGVWAVPPVRFLYFNIAQSLAVFYGRNRGDYYLTEALPLLLTTALPFAIVGLWQALRSKPAPLPGSTDQEVLSRTILNRLAWTSIVVTFTLSLISHKEVRFLYPVLPFLHILSARPLSSFFTPLTASRKATLASLLVVNLIIAGYASQVHQRGVLDVLAYLRHQHEARGHVPTSVGFLMPCHSTPWRSHFVHPGIRAWALTCEPPLNIPLVDRDKYLDEADQFYLDPGPALWLADHMEDTRAVYTDTNIAGGQDSRTPAGSRMESRKWPQYLVFFEQLEGMMSESLNGTRYRECWRGFNSHFHDDWRRNGDVVVWCLDG